MPIDSPGVIQRRAVEQRVPLAVRMLRPRQPSSDHLGAPAPSSVGEGPVCWNGDARRTGPSQALASCKPDSSVPSVVVVRGARAGHFLIAVTR